MQQNNYEGFQDNDRSEEEIILRASNPERFSGSVADNDVIVVKEKPQGEGQNEGGRSTGGASNSEGLVENGEYQYPNGAIYNGSWLGTQRHGQGTQVWPDGARYEGEWQDNCAHGRGTFYHADGDIFDGQWQFDKANGYGTYYNVNGSKYEGDWVDDLQHG